MPKGVDTPVNETLAKAAKLAEEFTVKELGVPYSAVKAFIEKGYIKVKGKRAAEGRGRNPVTFALTAKGKKAAA
jgi:predicted ArsR family transcriptional regulator